MDAKTQKRSILLFRLLTLVGLVLMVAAYFSPIWWVALKAPNYPPETFPDGVRIHFHFNGVFNGCELRENREIQQEEPLDCVHEMDTINHYIGMHPIERGAHVEIMLAPYIFVVLGLMLIAFLFYQGPLWWVLPLGAIALPAGFLIDFSAWLWWFGHSLNPWGAFTVKPFMPTVLGMGKIAQFSTYAYPHYGFGLLILCSLSLTLALLIRRKQLREVAQAGLGR